MTAASTRARLEPDERREQILECAVGLFGERPYSEVSTTELATAAGVTRGLIHHYFGTKRGLYLEVVRSMVMMPKLNPGFVATGPVSDRVERAVDWFLGTVEEHGKTFVAVSGAEGVGDDPEVERLLREADDVAARTVLEIVGVTSPGVDSQEHAVIRAYGALVKGTVREWIREGTLTRDEAQLLLVQSLLAIVRNVLPKLSPST